MPIPEQIGRYIIKTELGRGGMATVYRAYDPSFDREVALKILPREMLHDPQFRTRFEREIKLVASLEHPAIVPVYDVGDIEGQPYYVMRYMTGGSLSDLIAKGKFTVQETAAIIGKVAQGLAHAHRKNIVHRDLKPDNILFDENGSPFISDFGIAKLAESGSNLTGSGVIGTPAYMSPEQAQGKDVDGRSDVYGLGVIVYQMLTGHQPYSADTPMGVVVKHITEPVPEILKDMPDLPPEVDELIKTSMAKDKNKRFENTIELAKALNKIAFGEEGNLTFSTNSGVASRLNANNTVTPSKNRTGLIVIGVVLVVALIGFFLIRNQLMAPDATPTATIVAEQPTLTTVPITETSAPAFASACSADITFATPAEARLTDNRCQQRRPIASFAISADAEFELLNPEGSCRIESSSASRKVLSCTGPDFMPLKLKVCQPLQLSTEELNQCSPDSTFDSANQCCVAIPPEEAGCVILEVQLRGCN
ncbi:MAG: serine/threonine protein kinase [Anaerolineales bacterium]|nr:serine/threonine protein kinase [Anaerolineales bacterium]